MLLRNPTLRTKDARLVVAGLGDGPSPDILSIFYFLLPVLSLCIFYLPTHMYEHTHMHACARER